MLVDVFLVPIFRTRLSRSTWCSPPLPKVLASSVVPRTSANAMGNKVDLEIAMTVDAAFSILLRRTEVLKSLIMTPLSTKSRRAGPKRVRISLSTM